jgi:DNA-binding Lrp family transcriptional regulator
MRLRDGDDKLLHLLESNADRSFKELARMARCREHTVRRAFHRFVRTGLITGRTVYINTMKLGLTDHALYFSISQADTKGEHPFIKALKQSSLVRWLADVGGAFDYSATFLASSVGDVRAFLDRATVKYRETFLGKQLALRTYMVRFPRRYLSAAGQWRGQFEMELSSDQVAIDSVDRQILYGLSNSGFSTDADIARAIKISPSVFHRRRVALEDKGVIVGHTYRLNMTMLGYSSFRVLVTMKRLGADLRRRMLSFCVKHVSVRVLIESFGSWDYELELELPHSKAIKELTTALHHEFIHDIHSLQVIPIFQHLKYSGYPLEPS